MKNRLINYFFFAAAAVILFGLSYGIYLKSAE